MYSESLGAWAIWVYPNHAHGEPRPPATDMEKAKRLGLPHPVVHTRRAASAPASLFDYRQQCAGGLSADESKRFIHDWLLSHDAHGQQLDASVAFKRKTSQGSIYSVYCFNCKPMTCKWSPAVMYSESLRSWAIWVYPSHRHGDPRTTATVTNKGGRPRHGMKPDRGQLHLLRHTGQPYTRRELHAWIKRTLLLEQQIIVRCRRGPAVEGTLEVYIRCACHRMDDGQRCVWTGRMTYTRASGCGSLVGDAAERHGTQYLIVGKFTAQQRAVMHKLPGGSSTGTAHAALTSPRRCPHPRLQRTAASPQFTKPQVAGFMKRTRPQRGPRPIPRGCNWREVDFHQLLATWRPCTANTLQASDPGLRVVDSFVGRYGTFAVMLSGELLAQTLVKVANREYLKFALDGKFRMMFGKYVLLTLGIVTKHWGETAKRYAYTSTFHELGYCIAHRENGEGYIHLVEAIIEGSGSVGFPIRREHIRQWHSDMHKGILKARQCATHARPMLDWAHVTGATTGGRTGIFNVLKRLKDNVYHAFLHDWIYASRSFDRFLFHVVWSSAFDILRSNGEMAMADAIQGFYIVKADRADMYVDPEGEAQLWDGEWRIAHDVVQPGSASGTAAQESWQGNDLQRSIGHMRLVTPRLLIVLESRVVRAPPCLSSTVRLTLGQ